ncbi:MAG TPA: hypothetical protein V6D06_10795 [Trichocoleus sp.]
MSRPDDITLIQRFIAGGDALESNQNLRVLPANDQLQLLSRRGLVLAISDPAAHPPTIAIRSTSEFSEILNKVLLAHHYIPVGQAADVHFLNYQHCPIPSNYTVSYSPARDLWKQWWVRRNELLRMGLQMDLLVLTRGKWYPVRDIILAQSTLYISTHLGETAHMADDKIVWLEKDTVTTETKILPPLRGTTPPQEAAPKRPPGPTPTSAPVSQSPAPAAQCSEIAVSNVLQSVVRCVAGKLYIRTTMGEVVVEGNQLKCYPNRTGNQPTQPTANRVGIRPSP